MNELDLGTYQDFAYFTASDESKNFNKFISNLEVEQMETDVNLPLLLTAAIGLASEGGEFTEIVKKVLFQGKTMDQSVRFHMERELGDVLWYLANACTALNINLQQVMEENERKLKARYPEGFSVSRSENRAEGDI
tara:strand:- start:982 stop:1389 length:408 start_codon:yes stop_codon:yes gene_type:complete